MLDFNQLIIHDSIYNILLDTLDDSLKSHLIELESDVDRSITDITVNKDKSLILSIIFGKLYFKSLQLYLNSDIENGIIKSIVKRDKNNLLGKLGLVIKHGRLIKGVHNYSNHLQEIIEVDLNNWYCPCYEYQESYSNDMKLTINPLVTSNTNQFQNLKPICHHLLTMLIHINNNKD
ncbi:unnamed protein product [Candida verbasci]|uniref:Uncharacterized protein n=1 Tax=Candida verbasci TaxID=1227364 RepID=A0A9W4U034_9ASCO|nr:unnamed protein product [Candida verbasci]